MEKKNSKSIGATNWQKDYPKDDDLIDLLKSSVNTGDLRRRSGSYLSGGIDSILNSIFRKKSSFMDSRFNSLNEFEWGNSELNFIGTSHHEILFEEENFLNSAKLMIKKRKEPLLSPMRFYFMK
ncbi:MAG: hypothetical protein CM1200mP33_4380 [Chloroflexota bacterium]|nr:MAG: hypothetical protein CM1200mP33_4380 [Chloroflexota bacterium]